MCLLMFCSLAGGADNLGVPPSLTLTMDGFLWFNGIVSTLKSLTGGQVQEDLWSPFPRRGMFDHLASLVLNRFVYSCLWNEVYTAQKPSVQSLQIQEMQPWSTFHCTFFNYKILTFIASYLADFKHFKALLYEWLDTATLLLCNSPSLVSGRLSWGLWLKCFLRSSEMTL